MVSITPALFFRCFPLLMLWGLFFSVSEICLQSAETNQSKRASNEASTPSDKDENVEQREPSFLQQFKDSEDGKFDMSDWLINKNGFLPVPFVITEPAVGYGGGAALLFFHRKESELWVDKPGGGKKFNTPSISGAGGMATENGTWGAAVFHRGIWNEDTWRYDGALALFSANLTFYGLGDIDLSPIGGLDYNNKGWLLNQQIERRIADSDFFVGTRYRYMDFDNTFELGSSIPGLDATTFNSRNAGASLLGTFDSRDNPLTPSKGLFARVEGTVYDQALGGDFDYLYLGVTSLKYWQLSPKWVLGWRAQGEFTDGNVPFYAAPFVSLRGVPAMRYQGEQAIQTELELRWNFYQRYSAVAFGGVGWAAPKLSDIPDADTVYNRGFGLRYLAAKKLGLQTGIDFAWGPDTFAFYLVVGSGWIR